MAGCASDGAKALLYNTHLVATHQPPPGHAHVLGKNDDVHHAHQAAPFNVVNDGFVQPQPTHADQVQYHQSQAGNSAFILH